jgi:hypothetical protein
VSWAIFGFCFQMLHRVILQVFEANQNLGPFQVTFFFEQISRQYHFITLTFNPAPQHPVYVMPLISLVLHHNDK